MRPFLLKLIGSFLGIFLFTVICSQYSMVFAGSGIADKANTQLKTTPYLKEGLKHKANGEWEEAVNVWIQAWHKFRDEEPDFRIGSELLQLVTKEQVDNYYSLATQVYMWGLSVQDVKIINDYLTDEIHHMKPLLTEHEFKSWESYLINNNPELLIEIKQFWIDRDPAPNTNKNERLLEHYERLQYSKQHFSRENTTPFNTDDRGTIYLKYGQPDNKEQGDLRLNYGNMNRWVGEFLEDQDIGFDSNLPYQQTGQESFAAWISDQLLEDNIAQSITDNAFAQKRYSDYEVWIYEDIENQSRENLIFLFGEPAESTTFKLLEAPEELIPNSAFRQRNHTGSNVTFNYGPLYQLSVYQNLKFADDYFLDRFNDMENFLYMDEQAMYEESTTHRIREQNRRRMRRIQDFAPETSSIYDRYLTNYDFDVNVFRFLDSEMQPYFLFFVYSETSDAILQDHYELVAVNQNAESDYLLRHNINIRDKNLNVISNDMDLPDLQLYEEEAVNRLMQSTSTFSVRADYEGIRRIDFSSELFNKTRSNYKKINNEYYRLPEKVVGIEQTNISLDTIPALSQNELEVSDLLLGFGSEYAQLNNQEDISYQVPFYIPQKSQIPNGTNIDLLFEVYNLQPREDDNYFAFSVDYQVRRLDSGNWFSNLFRSDDADIEASLTLNFEVPENQTREHLTIDTSTYAPGEYELDLVITDQASNDQVEKSRTFKVVEFQNTGNSHY